MSKITTDASTTTAESHDIDASTGHRVLSDERRRVLCETVLEGPRSEFDLGHLAAAVAERQPGVDADDGDDHERVAASLHHVHLPLLDDAGFVEYEASEHAVTADVDAIDSLLG